MKRTIGLAAALLTLAVVPALPATAAPHPDADYSEAYFPSTDGVTSLHADILRPKGMPLDDQHKTPVILSVTPYANHSGSLGAAGVLNNDYGPTRQGPNERFYDFLNLSGALKQGYTYVMVDLPGFGGSSGCNDWGGFREQHAVRAAVEWAADQPWSNGKVALLGKSYDGWTGLMGIAQQPEGLAAVISLEPVFSGYRYLYNNGVRISQTIATIGLFQTIDASPGTTNDTPMYHANGAPQAWCYGVNVGLSQQDDENSDFWAERNLLPPSVGEETPLLLTQGFLETNTKPDAAFDYWNGLDTKDSYAWFGQFDHCRAWETGGVCGYGGGGNRLAVGRPGFIDQAMRFLDEHLKGIEPEVEDPRVVVQDNRGMYRAETRWPPEDMSVYWSELNAGPYADGFAQTGGSPIWTVSEPLPHDVWLSGEPRVKVRVETVTPNANLVAGVLDVAPGGEATMISRNAFLLRDVGEQTAVFDLYGQDWRVPAGHRIAVVVAAQDQVGWYWQHVPTNTTVEVLNAQVGLPTLYWEREPEEYLDGGSTPMLERYLGSEITDLAGQTISAAERPFDLPGPLVERPDEDEEETQTAP